MRPTIKQFWDDFIKRNPVFLHTKIPEAYHFCNNKKDADACAILTVQGIKQATSPSLWWYKQFNMPKTKVGDLDIITNFQCQPKAIIQFTKIEHLKFKDITAEYASIEGEGDKSLDYWKKVHWDYYAEEMKPFDERPSEDMVIVCQHFKTIWK